jgi:hypothetical protein
VKIYAVKKLNNISRQIKGEEASRNRKPCKGSQSQGMLKMCGKSVTEQMKAIFCSLEIHSEAWLWVKIDKLSRAMETYDIGQAITEAT